MDRRKPPTSKHGGRRRDTAPSRAISPRLIHAVLGVVLIAAGATKLYAFAFEAPGDDAATLLLAVFAEAELLGGLWLVGGFAPERTHWWALAAFVGLSASSLFQALAGKCSCGCFGSLVVSPWLVLVFDLAAVAALLAWRPLADQEEMDSVHPLHISGMILVAVLVGLAGWRQAGLVTVAGTATLDGRPLKEATLTFTGESAVAVRTDADGRFRVPLAGPGPYAVALSVEAKTPVPVNDLSAKGAGKKSSGRSKQPLAMAATDAGWTLLWIEVSECSEENRTIEFK